MSNPADGATIPAQLTQPQMTGGGFGTGLFGVTDLPAIADWAVGQRLGPYRLKSRLGKGGMGVVWLAEQLEPFQREVAIKLLPRELQSPLNEVYFEVERQALATLSHRAIAQIHDAGKLPDGALYFAMEYVPGQPLNRFLRDHPLTLKALVGLYVEICRGVQHAHQRGLIHRDLKPLNILVHLQDGRPAPKIIDFGIAIGARPGQIIQDHSGEIIGTPAYMAPEQKHPGPAGIDARVDVYALGAILVELLCRSAGLEADTGALDSSVRRAGLALSLGQPPSVAEQAAEAAALVDRLKTTPVELRAIAIQALSPDRDGRYDSAAALADDLEQWLQQRPVRAMGGGRWYLARCFMRRNRLATVAAAAVLIALVTGVLLALHGMNQARAAQALAEQRRSDAEALIQYMLGDFADKLRPLGRLDLLDSVGAKALDYLAAQDTSGDAGSLLSRARALRTLGEVRTTRQQYPEAESALKAADDLLAGALAAAKPDPELVFEAAQIAFYRGMNKFRLDDLEGVAPFWERYLDLAKNLVRLESNSVRSRRELGFAYANLGTLAERRGDLASAHLNIREALVIRRELWSGSNDVMGIDLARTLSWLASVQAADGDIVGAWGSTLESIRVLENFRRAGGDSALAWITEMNHRHILADYAQQLGRPDLAIAELSRAIAIGRELIAADPTQPRLQRQVARIGFTLGLFSELPQADVARYRGFAFEAMRTLGGQHLTSAERAELDLLEVANVLRENAADAVRAEDLLEQLLSAPPSDIGSRSGLIGAAASVVETLDKVRSRSDLEMRRRIRSLLEQTPWHRQNSLAFLVLKQRLSQPDERHELEARIDAIRSSFDQTDFP